MRAINFVICLNALCVLLAICFSVEEGIEVRCKKPDLPRRLICRDNYNPIFGWYVHELTSLAVDNYFNLFIGLGLPVSIEL